jgi:hypothetical protein
LDKITKQGEYLHGFPTMPSFGNCKSAEESQTSPQRSFGIWSRRLIGIEPGLVKAQDRDQQPRVSLRLQVGFFNGATALYITPEVGVDPKAPAAIIAAARQVAAGFSSNFIPQNFATLPGSPAVDDIFFFTKFCARKRAGIRAASCGPC